MKKLLITLSAVIILILAVVFLALPYYLGIKAEENLNEQQKMLSESSIISVESHQYDRGWFNSTETMTIRLKPSLLHNARAYLPENLKTVLQDPITVVNHVHHGLFASGFTPVQAKIDTELKYSPETAKVLARFFGNQTPVNVTNTIYLTGSGKISLTVPAFDYEELSGIKLDWRGLTGTTEYNSGFNNYTHEYAVPALHITLADKGDAELQCLKIHTNTIDGKNHLALGDSSIKLNKFSLLWKEGVSYNVKLNELVNLVTDLQIGAFINPTGTIAPSKIIVSDLQFDTKTNEADNWVNSEGTFKFGKMIYGNDQYGPLNINIAAEHLDAKSLLAIKKKLAEVAATEMPEDKIQEALLQTAKTDASGLFTNNPILKIKAFTFKMPQGTINVTGQLGFTNLTATEMNDFTSMIRKTNADFDVAVPKTLLEQLAISQASNLFSVNKEDLAAGRASLDDINETLRLMVDGTVSSMQSEGYLTLKNNMVNTHINLSNNQLKLNGKIFKTESEPEFDDSDMTSSTPANTAASTPTATTKPAH